MHLTGEQEVTGLIPAGSGNMILIMEYSRRAVVSVWQKNVHKYWLTSKRTKPAQEKCG